MPAKELPTFSNLDRYADTLRAEGASAYGTTGGELSVPDNDAAKIPSGLKDVKITSSHNEHAPLEAKSIATTSSALPQNDRGPDVNSLKSDHWMDRGSYPTSKTGGPTPPKQHGR